MDASDPKDHAEGAADRGDGPASGMGLVSGAAAPLWAAALFAERLRGARRSDAAATVRGLVCGVGDGALGRLGAAAFGAGPMLEAAGVGFEPVLDAEIAAAVHTGAQAAQNGAGDGVFGVFYASAAGLMRGGAAALDRARASGAPGGVLAVVADDATPGGEGSAAAALQLAGAPVLHPATPIEAVEACVAGLTAARATGDWVSVALPLSVVEATAYHARAARCDGPASWPEDHRTHGPEAARIGLVAMGDGWAALDRALALLGLDAAALDALGLSVWRLTRSNPLDAAALGAYAAELDALYIVDPAAGAADAVAATLYGRADAPTLGRLDASAAPFAAEALAVDLARALAEREDLEPERREALSAAARALASGRAAASESLAPPARGRGADIAGWIGAARWSAEGRRLVELDTLDLETGGLAAIRAAVRSRLPATFLLRWRSAPLWMQPARTEEDALEDGPSDDPAAPSGLAAQLAAAGVDRLGLLLEQGSGLDRRRLPRGARIDATGDLEAFEADLAEEGGVVAIIDARAYDGDEIIRSRGLAPEASVSAINQKICDGCGDCDRKISGDLAARAHFRKTPTDTGWARRLDFASAGVDAARLPGSCPAFIGAPGARRRPLRVPSAPPAPVSGLAASRRAAVIGFIGGAEAAQTARILAAAARRDGRSVGLWAAADGAPSIGLAALCRIDGDGASEAALAGPPKIGELDAVVECAEEAGAPTLPATLFRDPTGAAAHGGAGQSPQALGAVYFGAEAQAGLIALGAAYQKGALPVSGEALLDALAAECKTMRARAEAAFDLGRASATPSGAAGLLGAARAEPPLDELIERRAGALAEYQNAAWATRYTEGVASAARSEKIVAPDSDVFARAVAEGLFALMSYRDLYETARLVAETTEAAVEQAFESVDGAPVRPVIYLRSGLFAGRDDKGAPRKIGVGSWILPIMRLLKRGKVFRGGALDPAGFGRLRRLERELIRQYENDMLALGRGLSPERLKIAVEIARIPLDIRGFGPVKERAAAVAAIRRARLFGAFEAARGLGAAQERSSA